MFAFLRNLFARATVPPRTDPRVVHCASYTEAISAAIDEAASLGGSVYPTRGTGSMLPLIPAKIVQTVLKPTPLTPALIGRVIVYRAKWAGDNVMHRLRAQLPTAGYLVRGDNNPADDPEAVTPANYLGEVTAIYIPNAA